MLSIWHLLIAVIGIFACQRYVHASEVGREGEAFGMFSVAVLMFGMLAYDGLRRMWLA